ncbi:MAG TPA: adenylate/guanylate cyclase domain-containing protein [Gammaproteobacteria bacterium]
MTAWLREHDLGHYAPLFAEQHIDGAVLSSLTDSDLKELGVTSLGHRKKLLRAIAALATAAATPADPLTAERDGERRQATVLFADLAGYTVLTRELGGEETHALTDRFFAAADQAIISHGGTIDKRIGDCLMAVFGAPIAHTDDPERAVRAAVAIRAAMPELGRSVGKTLEVHIGVAMGQVIASTIGTDHHRQYAITGDSVNLAARLTSRARDGEILLSDELRSVLDARVETEPLEELTVKGFDRPVRAWRLTAIRVDVPARTTPFVGRRAELALFVRSLETCRETGRGMTIHIRGEAGIGKSRLIAEIVRLAAERDYGCHAGAALDFGGGAGRNPIRAIVRSLAGDEPCGSPAEQAFLNDLAGSPQPAELVELTAAMDHATRHKSRLAALAALVRRASAARPTLLVVEDVHWADEAILDHLAGLCAGVADCRALLVMTSRVESDPLGAAWRSRTFGSPLLTVDLGPLRESDATALAGALLDASSPLARSCVERANGNPLFLEQLLRHAAVPGANDIPATIQSVVLARADKLAPSERRALQAAAVLGQRFTLTALRHLLGDATYSPEALVEHLLVRPDGDELVFLHALIRDGVYAALLRSGARAFHATAADWYRDRDATVHAEHLDRAGDPAAARAYAAAAVVETKAFKPHAALALVRRGVACAKTSADKHALAALEAEIQLDLAEVPGAIAAASRALEHAATARERCAARLSLASGMRVVDRLEDAFATLDAAERDAAADALTEELARIHHLRGNLYFPQGRFADCRAAHEHALTWAKKASSAELEARALSGIGDAEYMRGRYRTAADYFANCLALAHARGLRKVEVANRGMLAITRWFTGGAALDEADGAVEAARRVSHARGELIAQHGRLMALIGQLRLDEARASVARARALAQQLGSSRFEAENLWFLAAIERLAGKRDAAAAVLREALRLSRATSIGFFGASILGSLALCTDDTAERTAALDEGERLLDAGSVSHNHFFFARDAIDSALLVRDFDRALHCASRLRAYTAAEPLPWSDLIIGRAEALIARARGAIDRSAIEAWIAAAHHLGQRDLLPALELP